MEKLQKFQEHHNQFIKANLETTYRLIQIINGLFQNKSLHNQLLLKGGASVQIYLQDLKRLFLDIDLDIVSSTIVIPEEEKKWLQSQILLEMKNLSYEELSPKSRYSYSLDSLRFPFYHQTGNLNYAKLDINYSFGKHLYPPSIAEWGGGYISKAMLINLEELLGMKLKAILARNSIKDIYDIYLLIQKYPSLNNEHIRKSFLFYYTLSDYTISPEKIGFPEPLNKKQCNRLNPYIEKESHNDYDRMQKEVREFASDIFHFTKEEIEFFSHFQKRDYYPELLFAEKEVIEKAQNNPIANYKLKLARKYQNPQEGTD